MADRHTRTISIGLFKSFEALANKAGHVARSGTMPSKYLLRKAMQEAS